MKEATKLRDKGFLPDVLGLKNSHSYHIIKVQQVELDNGELEYLMFIRNPTGNIYLKDHEVTKLKWNPRDDETWTPKTRKQCNYYTTKADYELAIKRSKMARKAFKAGKVDPMTKIRRETRKKTMRESKLRKKEQNIALMKTDMLSAHSGSRVSLKKEKKDEDFAKMRTDFLSVNSGSRGS